MKVFRVFLVGVIISIMSTCSMASEQDVTEMISCSLPGKVSREVLLSINDKTKEITYTFKKEGKVELSVLFNEGNKLKRLTDSKMGVVYYGFNRGKYGYVIDIISGAEKEEYSMTFDVKKNNKIIQSNDCFQNSFRSDDIPNNYITDVPYVDSDNFIFP
ncbi:hypothetical protein [Erwinia tasmaniensis]|uniref:hypothetical protein n=1 Tax=Erwinia tasmaniensis TaxID=338565 RepID=UPI003A4E38A6